MANFEWYRSFIAVYRSGTVSRAAEARAMTQPAISQHISALEASIDQLLFQRTPRKMVPTESGKALYSQLAPLVDNLEKVSVSFSPHSVYETPLIRLGAPLDYFHEQALKKLMGANYRYQVKVGDTAKMLDDLHEGSLDAVIATQQAGADNIDYWKIDQEAFCLVSSPDIKIPSDTGKHPNKLCALEAFLTSLKWISYATELPIIRRFWYVAFERRPSIEPEWVIPSLLAIRKAVELNYGVSVLPHYLCKASIEEGHLKVLWKPDKPVINDLWLATRKVDRNKPLVDTLIKRLA